jgi:hypothetical protein
VNHETRGERAAYLAGATVGWVGLAGLVVVAGYIAYEIVTWVF